MIYLFIISFRFKAVSFKSFAKNKFQNVYMAFLMAIKTIIFILTQIYKINTKEV